MKERLEQASGKEKVKILNRLIQEDSTQAYREYFTMGVNLAQQQNDISGEIDILCSSGDRFLADGNTAQALANYTRGLELSRNNGFPQKEMTCLNNLASLYETESEFDKAGKLYMQALALARKINYKEGIAITLQNLGLFYVGRLDYNKSLYFFKEELKADRSLGDSSLVADCLNNIGMVHYSRGEYKEGISYYERSLSIRKQLGEETPIARSLLNTGIAYREQGTYDKALEHLLEAARYFEKKGPSIELGSCYNTTGNILLKLGSADKALTYHFMALKIREQVGNKRGVAGSLTNIGDVYKHEGNYDKALEYLNRSLVIKEEIGDKKLLASTHDHLGDVYFRVKLPAKAAEHYNMSVTLKRQFEDPKGMATTYNNLGKLYLSGRKYTEAFTVLDSARDISSRAGARDILLENYKYTAQGYREAGIHDQAFKYYELHAALKDSIMDDSRSRSMAEMQVKYETEKKEQAIILLEEKEKTQAAEMENQRFKIWGLTGAAALLAISTGLALVLVRVSSKAKRQKELMMKELHHRVKNNMQVLSSLLFLQISRSDDESIKNVLTDVDQRIRAMILVHQDLYGDKAASNVNMQEYVPRLVEHLRSSSTRYENVKINVNIDSLLLDADKALSLGFMINELVSNALKHAFHNTSDPVLSLSLLNQGGTIVLDVHDNGNGFSSASLQNSSSFGLRMVQMFLKDLKGKMDIRTEKGTQFLFEIPA